MRNSELEIYNMLNLKLDLTWFYPIEDICQIFDYKIWPIYDVAK